MAGPLSSEEIEDVVSSVRRLVSNELSPRRLSRDLNGDRLILTPSLRVVSETSPLAPLVLEERVEEPSTPDAQPVISEPLQTPADTEAAVIEAEWEDELWVEPESAPLGEVALAAEEAEVLGPVFEPDAWPTDAPAMVDTEPDLPEDRPVAPDLRLRAESLAARLAAGAVVDEPLTDTSRPITTETAAELDADIAEAADAGLYAPGGVGPSEAAPDDVLVLSAALAVAATVQDTAPRMPTEIIDADGTPLTVLDEAALQEIVRQMIREELQGDLGERITRNVRKLVRAEINRALIARDLD